MLGNKTDGDYYIALVLYIMCQGLSCELSHIFPTKPYGIEPKDPQLMTKALEKIEFQNSKYFRI